MTDETKPAQERIDQLERVINDTRDEFNQKILTLKSELSSLRQLIQVEKKASAINPADISTAFTHKQSPASIKQTPESVNSSINTTESNSSASITPVTVETDKIEGVALSTTTSDWNDSGHQNRTITKPSRFNVFLSKFFVTIFCFILSRLTVFITPFQGLFHKLINLYNHYKEQGKAPVFLMTVAGLFTLTVGFAYLLQYSFHTLFNETLKAITGFVIGIGIIGVGALLAKKKTDFREYAASVIALGVIFNYLTAYFIGPYYGIVSETTGFALLMVVTLVSFSLALLYETKVVAFVTLVGGVLMPLLVANIEAVGLVFVLYLFIISVANLYLSYKIKWPSLSHITFILSLSVLEYTGISSEINPLIVVLLLTAFFYMYSYYWSFDGVKIKEKLSRYDLTVLVSNVFYFLYAMLQVTADSTTISSVLFLHAVLLVFIVFSLQLLKTALAPVYLLMIGLLVATSAFVLAPIDITSVIWAIEGLVLVLIGFKYSHKIIRAEGYAIYLIAVVTLLWQLLDEYSISKLNYDYWYWANLLAFGGLGFWAYRLIDHYKETADKLELKASVIQNEVYTLWGAICLSLLSGVLLPELINVLIIVPIAWCFYRVSIHRLRFAQAVGFYFFIGLIFNVVVAMFHSNTSVISLQTINTWLLLVEMLFIAWGLYFYYLRFELQGRGQKLAKKCHQLVFYIPITLLVFSLLQISWQYLVNSKELTFSYLWFDFIIIGALLFIGYFVVSKTETLKEGETKLLHHTILNETGSLFLSVFFLYTVAIVFNEWMFNAVAVPLLFLLYRGVKEKLPLTELLAWSHFMFFAVMTWINYQAIGNFHFGEQTWSTKIAWAELLVCAWAMQMIYDRMVSKDSGYEVAKKLRIAVYLLIPLLFLPRIFRLYTEYLPVFIWLSFAISWLMYKKLQVNALLKQLSVLFFVAFFATVLMALNAVTGAQQLPGLAALLSGVLILTIFHYTEKTIQQPIKQLTIYSKLQLSSPYFYVFALTAFTYALTSIVTLSLLSMALFLLFIIQQSRLQVVMRKTIRLAYLLVWSSLIAIPVLVFTKNETSIVSIAVILSAIMTLWYLTHQSKAVFIIMQRKHMAKNVQLWLFHALVFISYTGILNGVFESWSVGTSIAMLMHAVLVLFLTLKDDYKALLRLSVVLYGFTAAKVLFHDMNDFSHIHKIIALMCMGSILMVAAYFFQKERNKRDISIA